MMTSVDVFDRLLLSQTCDQNESLRWLRLRPPAQLQ
jgi:hypothetical protein